jgi:hypothetical protein
MEYAQAAIKQWLSKSIQELHLSIDLKGFL